MKIQIFSLLFLALTAAPALADNELNTQLDELKLPGNVAPAGVTNEKLYSVQNRFATL
jgi:hypothetical protein